MTSYKVINTPMERRANQQLALQIVDF